MKPRKPIARVSPRMKERLKEYRTVKAKWMKEHKLCILVTSHCTGLTQAPHHKRGRAGSLLCDVRFWLPVCNSCHRYIHDNTGWSRKSGYIEHWGKQTP